MPNTTCDLHIHSYYSDGWASPASLLHYADEIGLKTISITDHDNINAYKEARHVASSLGLELIPGIELTANWDECSSGQNAATAQDVDFLGYFFDPYDPAFQDFVRAVFSGYVHRIQQCCNFLTEEGYPVTLQDILDENPRYPAPMHLISVLWKKRLAGSEQAALRLFETAWTKVQPVQVSPGQVIAAIHAAGGVAILAHPVAVRCGKELLTKQQVATLVDAGLDGLEIYHPAQDAATRQHFWEIARNFQLLISGGSDEHGRDNHFSRMGSQPVTYEIVNALSARSKQRKEKLEK